MKESNDTPSFQSDSLQRFIFDNAAIRGEWVHLHDTWQAVTSRRSYPVVLQTLLGEMMSAAALLAATVKIDGRLVLQIKSTGPVKVLMVECTSDDTLRAFAQWDEDAAMAEDATLVDLTGEGTLAITIEVDGAAQPYQGVVALDGGSIPELLETYFRQSEQLKTRVWLSANTDMAAGLLLQQLPHAERSTEEDEEEAWVRISHLASTVSQDELVTLGAGTLLHRLFHEEICRLLTTTILSFACSCSRERVANTINLLGQHDAMELVEEQETIEVACEFCNEHYYFDKADVALIFAHSGAGTIFDSGTVH